MAIIIDIDHEGGDLTEYTSTVTDSGDLSVAAGAALAGTGYGLSVLIDDTTAIYGIYDLSTANTSGTVRLRFYIDPNSLTMADTNEFAVVYGYNSTPAYILIVMFNYTTATGYRLRAMTYDDAGTGRYTDYTNITDAPHYVEVLLTRAATVDSNDGTLTLWVDGSQTYTRANLDNNTRFANFDSVRLGATGGIDADTSGTFYLDELVVNDDGSEIGPVSSGYLVGVSETIGSSEAASAEVSAPAASAQDTVGAADAPALAISAAEISVSETITTDESTAASVTALGTQTVSVSETIGTAEATSAQVGAPQASASDSIGTTDSPALIVSGPQASASDTIGVADSPTLATQVEISKSDNIGASDSATLHRRAVWYNADAIVVNVGEINNGTIESTWTSDDNRLDLLEAIGAPGFSYDFYFYDVPASAITIDLEGYYQGNPGHVVKIQQYNFTGSTWTNLTADSTDFPSTTSEQIYSFAIFNDSDYVSSGEMRIRLYHSTAGAVTHHFYIDHLLLDTNPAVHVTETIGTTDTPALAVGTAQITVSETIGASDTTTLTVSTAAIGVSEAIGVTESVTLAVLEAGQLNVSVSDTAGLAEAATTTVSAPDVTISEAISLAEAVTGSIETPPETLGIAITPDSVFAVGVRIY